MRYDSIYMSYEFKAFKKRVVFPLFGANIWIFHHNGKGAKGVGSIELLHNLESRHIIFWGLITDSLINCSCCCFFLKKKSLFYIGSSNWIVIWRTNLKPIVAHFSLPSLFQCSVWCVCKWKGKKSKEGFVVTPGNRIGTSRTEGRAVTNYFAYPSIPSKILLSKLLYHSKS